MSHGGDDEAMIVTGRKRVAIYARASSGSQTVESQIQALRAVASRQNWEIVCELSDQEISRSKGRDQRPQFDELLKRATRHELDLIAVWSIGSLGRSVPHLISFMSEVQRLGVDLYAHQQALDTTTTGGRMIFGVFSALGDYERELIRERIIGGQKRARGQGVKIGRPSRMNDAVRTSVRMLHDKGVPVRQISKRLEIGVGTVYSVLRAA